MLDPGDTTVSMQALSVVAIALAATACAWLVSSVYSRFWAGVATAIAAAAALAEPSVSYGGGMTELFGVTGLAVCIAMIGGMLQHRPGLIWPAVAGAGFAWAIGCSLLSVAAVPALALLWLSIPIDSGPYALTRSRWRTSIHRRLFDQRLAAAIVGAAAVSLVVWWPVLASGALPAAVDALVKYNELYSAANSYGMAVRTLKDSIGYLSPLWLPTLVVCAIPTAGRRLLGFNVARSNLAWAAVLWLVAELALLMLGRRFAAHSLPLFVPPLALLFGFTLCSLWSERPLIRRLAVGWAMCAAVALGLGWQLRPAPPTDSQIAANAQLAAYVRANSAPGDTIYVWGADPDIYLRSDRDPAGPYFELYALIMPGYDSQAVATMLRSWQAHPPRLIVTSRSTTADTVGLFPLVGDLTSDPALEPLRTFVTSHYDLVATFDVGEVWRYRA
jgi:hypothetical protein